MRILIVNEEVYQLTEQQFLKVLSMHDSRRFTKEEKESSNFTDCLKWRIHHDKACEYVRENFTPLMTADMMWRDD